MESVVNNRESPSAVIAFLEEQSAILRARRYWDCLKAAREISRLLLAEGRRPWLARLRKRGEVNGEVFHFPLTPQVPGVIATWTTHYLCCCDETAYDPVAGQTLSLATYTQEVFGAEIPLTVYVPAIEIQAYLEGRWTPES